jgi:hypothetical protein
MKKFLTLGLILILVISLLAACGGKNGDSSGSTESGNSGSSSESDDSGTSSESGGIVINSENQDEKIIKSSELITLEDAMQIIGMDLQVFESEGEATFDLPESFGGLRTAYVYDDGSISVAPPYMLQINIFQNALLDKNNVNDMNLIELGGVSYYAGNLKQSFEDSADEFKGDWIDGMGDWAFITKSPYHSIKIYSNEYLLEVTITGREKDGTRSDEEESAWKVERLIEAGSLALERLENLIG